MTVTIEAFNDYAGRMPHRIRQELKQQLHHLLKCGFTFEELTIIESKDERCCNKLTHNLEFCTVDQLVAELAKRHSASLVVLEKDDRAPGKTSTFTDWRGPLSTCIGLASRAHNNLLRKANEHERAMSDDT